MAIITISRGNFSGGGAVAEALGRKLGYPCVSKEILFDAAEEFGLAEEKLVATFEKPPQSWNDAPNRRINLLSYVRYALLKRIENENLVYHGYAGHLLLGDISHVIRVRIIAEMEYRIQNAIEQQSLSRKDAIATIQQQDKQSRRWVQFLYGVNWEHPSLYDTVLNLEHIDVDGAAAIIEKMTDLDRFKHTQVSRKAFLDQLLTSQVWAALTKNERTASCNVRITAEDGDVTLTGSIDSERTIETLKSVAQQVQGVKQVKCINEEASEWLW